MSSRYDRDDLPVLPEEDDWFATPFQEPMETDEVAWQDDEPAAPPPRHAPDGLAQRQIVIVLAVLAIIAVIVIAVLLVRAVSGSDSSTTPPVTTATTPTDTTPASTTPNRHDADGHDADGYDARDHDADDQQRHIGADEATLRPGTTGSSVTDLQKALNQLGYDAGTADGNYGAGTTAAVTAFQKDKGLTQDGVAGPTTLTAINTALAAG